VINILARTNSALTSIVRNLNQATPPAQCALPTIQLRIEASETGYCAAAETRSGPWKDSGNRNFQPDWAERKRSNRRQPDRCRIIAGRFLPFPGDI